jgi:hypothetical protein
MPRPEKVSEKLWTQSADGALVTKKALTRLIKTGADIEWKSGG